MRGEGMQVKNIEIGTGLPKIVVSTTKTLHENIKQSYEHYSRYQDDFDILEIRADYFDALDDEAHINTVNDILSVFKTHPVIYTYRTKREGGEGQRTVESYQSLLRKVIERCAVDIVDIEYDSDKQVVSQLIDHAVNKNVKVLLSNHDFNQTPTLEEMQKLLYRMNASGGDILKVAYRPQSGTDTLSVLSAVRKGKSALGPKIVGISMGETGVITRLAGGAFGSCMTYGYVVDTAAPGQVHASKIRNALKAYE